MPPFPRQFFASAMSAMTPAEPEYTSTLLAYGVPPYSATRHGFFGRCTTDVLAPIAVLLTVGAFAFGFVALFHCWANRRMKRAATVQVQSVSTGSVSPAEEGKGVATFPCQTNGQSRRLKGPALTIVIPGKQPPAGRTSSATFYLP